MDTDKSERDDAFENGRVNVIEHLLIRDAVSGRALINRREKQITPAELDGQDGQP